MAERRHIINNLHKGRTLNARHSAADAIFKCSLNKRSQFPVPLSMSAAAAERRQHGAGLISNGAQVDENYTSMRGAGGL